MNAERLLQLANHLKVGKLGRDKFDFSTYGKENDITCKTAGCALGEASTVWPEYWLTVPLRSSDGDYRRFFAPVLIQNFTRSLQEAGVGKEDVNASAMTFFSLSESEVNHLFYPWEQDTRRYGGHILFSDATKEQVADNIIAFVNTKK